MRDVTFTDERTPVEPAPEPASAAERLPLGALVRYSTTQVAGRHALVAAHPADDVVELLDGADRVTLSGDELAGVVVMGFSADDYAQRVSRTAREMAEVHGFCNVAQEAIEQLNRTPAHEADDGGLVHVVVTTTEHFTLRPTRSRDRRDVLTRLRQGHGVSYSRWYDFAVVNRSVDDVTVKVVDALPTNGSS